MSKKPKEVPLEEPALPFGGGVIMPHVVSPEIAGSEVNTPRIVPKMVNEEGETNEQ